VPPRAGAHERRAPALRHAPAPRRLRRGSRADPARGHARHLDRPHREPGRIRVPAEPHQRAVGQLVAEEPASEQRRFVRRRPEPELFLPLGLGQHRVESHAQLRRVSRDGRLLGARDRRAPRFHQRARLHDLGVVPQLRGAVPLSLGLRPVEHARSEHLRVLRRLGVGAERLSRRATPRTERSTSRTASSTIGSTATPRSGRRSSDSPSR
jgi:hypothetical protein